MQRANSVRLNHQRTIYLRGQVWLITSVKETDCQRFSHW